MKQKQFRLRYVLLIAGAVLLSGCAAESSELPGDVSNRSEPLATAELATEQDNGTEPGDSSLKSNNGSVRIPEDFWPGAPIPDFELVDVTKHDERDYVLHMRGSDLEDNAYEIEALLVDEGFHRLAWGITEERGANGIFLTEDTRVTLNIEERSKGIEINYGVGPYSPE